MQVLFGLPRFARTQSLARHREQNAQKNKFALPLRRRKNLHSNFLRKGF